MLITGAGTAPVISGPTPSINTLTISDGTGAGQLAIENLNGLVTEGDIVIGHALNGGIVTVDASSLYSEGALTLTSPNPGDTVLTIQDNSLVVAEDTITIGENATIQFTGAGGTSDLEAIGAAGIVNDGTLFFDQDSGTITISDQISGNGVILVSAGAGTAELTGANEGFQGRYIVNSGTLLAGSSTALGGESGMASMVVNGVGGTLDLNGHNTQFSHLSGNGGTILMGSASMNIVQSATTTYAGDIQGSGTLGKSGTGTLILAGNNTYDGGTLISQGTLRVVDGMALADSGDVVVLADGTLEVDASETVDDVGTSGTVSIADGQTLTADAFHMEEGSLQGGALNASAFNLSSGTVSTDLTGAGVLSKTGTGTLTLSGQNDFTGGSTVSDGVMIVNGTLGDVLVSGGTLGGTGALGAVTVNSGGSFAPGNSIGTTNVASVTFNPGSTYTVELNDGGFVAGTNNDLIASAGNVTINGGTVHVTPENGTDTGITYALGSYTIITGTGGSGAFDAITDDFAFLDFALQYDPNSVVLNSSLAVNSFCLADMTENQCATADGAFSLGLGNDVFTALLPLGKAEAAGALDQLSGEIHASAKTALLEDSRFAREAALDRLRTALGGAGKGAGQATQETPEGTTLWAQGFGAWSHWDGDGNAAEMSRNIGGLFMGGDAEIANNIVLGLMGGYSRSGVSVSDRMSSATVDSYTLGAYAGGNWDAFSLKGGLAHSWHSLDTSRVVDFTGFTDSLSASYNARTFQAYTEAAYSIEAGNARIEPFANLAYVNLNTDGFTENGGAAALTAASQSSNATFTTLGIRGETTVALGETIATLSGGLGWRHAFGDAPTSTHSFASGGDAFTVTGVPLSRDALVLDAGFDVNISDNATFGLSYNGQLGSGVSDHGAKAGFQVLF